MKKVKRIVLLLLLTFSMVGCGARELTYYGNLGYDFSKVDYESIVFHVYHSNTDDHTWELLKTFSCSPEKEHFADIRLEGKENCITLICEDNYVETTEDSQTFFTDETDSYEFTVEGFQGEICGFQTFQIKDTDEEQFYRLFPISNSPGSIFPHLSLDKPYDEKEENIDNILVTIKIQ